jgi:hypothetical protein
MARLRTDRFDVIISDVGMPVLSGFQIHLARSVDPAELLAAVASAAGRTGLLARSAQG